MKKIIVFICAMLLIAFLQAQTRPDAQKEIEKAKAMLKDPSIAAKLKMAQKMSDSIANNANTKSKLQKANTELNKVKAEHPNEVSNVQLSNSINTKTPSADAITAEMNSANSLLQKYNQQVDQTMPKRDISKHADKLLQLSKNSLLEMAKYELNLLKPKLSFNEKDTINLLLKNTDNNLAGIGVFVLSSGGSRTAGAYLICEGVTKR